MSEAAGSAVRVASVLKLSGWRRAWKRRVLLLYPAHLAYGVRAETRVQLRRALELTDIRFIEATAPSARHPHCMTVVFRDYTLCVDLGSRRTRDEWMQLLNRARNLALGGTGRQLLSTSLSQLSGDFGEAAVAPATAAASSAEQDRRRARAAAWVKLRRAAPPLRALLQAVVDAQSAGALLAALRRLPPGPAGGQSEAGAAVGQLVFAEMASSPLWTPEVAAAFNAAFRGGASGFGDRFQLRTRLHSSRTCDVFEAVGASSGAPVVVRRFRLDRVGDPDELQRRASLLCASRVPHVAHVLHVAAEGDNELWVATEPLVCRGDGAGAAVGRAEARGLLRALAGLHGLGLVHGDVRADSLFARPADGGVALCAMGSARGRPSPAADLRGLAELLVDCAPADLVQGLRDGSLSAAEALQHRWLTRTAADNWRVGIRKARAVVRMTDAVRRAAAASRARRSPRRPVSPRGRPAGGAARRRRHRPAPPQDAPPPSHSRRRPAGRQLAPPPEEPPAEVLRRARRARRHGRKPPTEAFAAPAEPPPKADRHRRRRRAKQAAPAVAFALPNGAQSFDEYSAAPGSGLREDAESTPVV